MKKLLFLVSFVLIISTAGCTGGSTFSGSKTGNDKQFLVDFDVLSTTVDHKMQLSVGDEIDTSIDIKKGEVGIIVKNEKDTIAYRGNGLKNCNFTFEITEAGEYTFCITGFKTKGKVYFIKK